MRRLFWRRAGFLALSLCLILAAALVPTRAERQVLLCGEAHDEVQCKEQELALWRACYAAGDRDLFLELGAATTELLNRWMRTGVWTVRFFAGERETARVTVDPEGTAEAVS